MSANSPRAQTLLEKILTDTPPVPKESPKSVQPVRPTLAQMTVSLNGEEAQSLDGLQALLRNSLAGDVERPTVNLRIAPASQSLAKDGCDFILMGMKFLDRFGCPEQARLFVLAVCALSRGDGDNYHVMTGDQLAELIGCERHAAKGYREQLIKWQYQTDYAFIDVRENGRDPETRKWLPTEYRARIVPYISEFVTRARATRAKNEHYAYEQELETGYNDIIDDIADRAPTSPLVERRKQEQQKKAKQQETQKDLLYREYDRALEAVATLFGSAALVEVNPVTVWADFKRDAALKLSEVVEKYPRFAE